MFTNSFAFNEYVTKLISELGTTSRLGSLGVYLLPEFFNVSDGVRLNFLSVWAEKLDRLAEGFENFPRWTASSLLQYRLLGAENYVTITSLLNAFSTTLDASFVKVASWSYFKLLLNQSGASNIFTQDLLRKLANSLAAEDLLPGQVLRNQVSFGSSSTH